MSPLVSVGLPVRNGAGRMDKVVRSVLAQDHADIELVICDNASTDDTEEYCRSLVSSDGRVVYHRQPRNVGLLNNFRTAIQLASGTYFRWVGDDDWLAPSCVSRGLAAFAEDPRRVLVTSRIAYTGGDGVTMSDISYTGAELAVSDPVARVREMLRLLNESPLLVDPLYGMARRAAVVDIPRRNMLREDEVFAVKLALAGPWGHVPQVLGHRNTKVERQITLARRLGVPAWQARVSATLQAWELWRWLATTPLGELSAAQRRAAQKAVLRMYTRRQRRTLAHRARKAAQLAAGRRNGVPPSTTTTP